MNSERFFNCYLELTDLFSLEGGGGGGGASYCALLGQSWFGHLEEKIVKIAW